MLVFTRKRKEKIMISDNIEIEIIETNKDYVRIGITAPRDIPVHREEVYKRIHFQNSPQEEK